VASQPRGQALPCAVCCSHCMAGWCREVASGSSPRSHGVASLAGHLTAKWYKFEAWYAVVQLQQ
jgi:hypothetical protein